jgi:predicted ATPase/DNA-binding winged helix-turn-helix (wHTH) protein
MSDATSSPTCTFAGWRLMPAERRLLAESGRPAALGGRAFDMLVALVERRHRVVGSQELLDIVWPRLVVEPNNLQVQVAALRKVLGHGAIATVPGRGYRFVLPVREAGGAGALAEPGFRAAGAPLSGEAATVPRHEAAAPPASPGAGGTRLLGREAELADLRERLVAGALVTITGPGGIGKTCLADAAAAARRAAGGLVVRVDLAPAGPTSPLAAVVACEFSCTLGREMPTGARPLESLLRAAEPSLAPVAGPPAGAPAPLLLLNNAEHLHGAVAELVAEARRLAPWLAVLVTSQERLRIDAEQVLQPGPLALPEVGTEPGVAEAASHAAVALFVARAKAAEPRFALRADNVAAVIDICRHLDGVPLAIELAAARLPLLGVAGLRARLAERLELLTAGRRDGAERQKTLRAALDWSHGLLAPAEQRVFRRLAVFAGGFTLAAAEAVVADPPEAEEGDAGAAAHAGGPLDGWDVVEHLGALVQKSLVLADGIDDATTPPRYRLLETCRLFALERLVRSGEAPALGRLHRAWMTSVAEAAERELLGGWPERGLAALDTERHNLFAALAFDPPAPPAPPAAVADPAPDDALRLAAAVRYYWSSRGLLAEGRRLTTAVLARPGAQARTALRSTVLSAAAQMCDWMGEPAAGEPLFDEALEIAKSCGSAERLARALGQAAQRRVAAGDADAARALAEAALATARPLGDGEALANALGTLALVRHAAGRRDEAIALWEEDLAVRHRIDHPFGVAVAALNLAIVALDAEVPQPRPNTAAARARLRQVVEGLPRIGSRYIVQNTIDTAAFVAAAEGDAETAVAWQAASGAQREAIGLRPCGIEGGAAAHLAAAAAALPEAVRTAATARGRRERHPETLERLRAWLACA